MVSKEVNKADHKKVNHKKEDNKVDNKVVSKDLLNREDNKDLLNKEDNKPTNKVQEWCRVDSKSSYQLVARQLLLTRFSLNGFWTGDIWFYWYVLAADFACLFQLSMNWNLREFLNEMLWTKFEFLKMKQKWVRTSPVAQK